MGQFAEMIAVAARRTQGYSQKLLVGIKAEQAGLKPRFETTAGVKIVDANHPMFVYGHLGTYPARLWTIAGLDGSHVTPPAPWIELFKAGVECKDDPKGTIYPKWDEVVAHYHKSLEAAVAHIAKFDDAFHLKEHPDPKTRENFPLIGNAVLFMYNNHVMMHLGQISTWRRCFGLPSAF
jgi:hypothetical protein